MTERREEPRDLEGAPDPWKDGPRWSDSPVAPQASSAVQHEGGRDAAPSDVATASDASSERTTCPWCAARTEPGATRCPSCGAALAQREAIGDLVIPGLTSVDPALKDYANRPLHLSGPSPSHGVASGAIAAAAIGGPAGLAIIGGVAAVAAAEYLGAGRGSSGGTGAAGVGEASNAVLQAIDKLDRGEDLPAADATTPRPELAAPPASGVEPATQEEPADGGD